MNRHCTTLLGLVLACSVALPVGAAAVHKWVDADGVTHYSDKPPDSVETTLIELSEPLAVKTASEDGRPADDYYSISNQWQRMNQERLERDRLNLERERIRAARQTPAPAATVAEGDNIRYVPIYSGFRFHRQRRPRHHYVAVPHLPQPPSPPPAPPLTGVISPR